MIDNEMQPSWRCGLQRQQNQQFQQHRPMQQQCRNNDEHRRRHRHRCLNVSSKLTTMKLALVIVFCAVASLRISTSFSPAIQTVGRHPINKKVQNHPRIQHERQEQVIQQPPLHKWSKLNSRFFSSVVDILDPESVTSTTSSTSTTSDDQTKINDIRFNDDDNRIYTIQILMSDTGGGHRASANALRDALDVLYPGRFVCDIVDLYSEYGPFWPYNDYPRMYKLMANYPWTWDLFYKFGETDFGLALNEFLLTTFCTPSFRECLQRREHPSTMVSPKQRPDMVVSVHPLCQDVPLKVLAELDGGKRTTPFVTVVTDLGGAHKTWFNPSVDKCFVPSDVLNEKAKSRGLKSSQIVQHGLPVRRGFWADADTSDPSTQQYNDDGHGLPYFATEKKDSTKLRSNDNSEKTLREELGLHPHLPTCLVVGGGDGMGGIADIAVSLGQELGKGSSQPTSQMVVVCGKNQQAQESLKNVKWGDGVNVSVQGFVSNMDEWMNAADCLVTKAGPGTIAEASICGLPCMLFAYLPGQEEGNVPFVEENGFGAYSSDPKLIAETVSSWLRSPEQMENMKTAALASSRPNSTIDIAKDLAAIAFSTTAEAL